MDRYILGKYVNHDSFIHRLDPRCKVLALIMMIVSVFLSFQSWTLTLTLSGINLILIFLLMLIAHVRMRDILFQLKSIWLLVILLLLINLFIPPKDSSHVIFVNGGFKLYAESLLQSLKIVLRLIEMFSLAMVLTASTTPSQLTDSFSFFFRPLRKIKFPSEEVAMTISIALRFIPTLLEETNRIYKSQASRGMDFRKGTLGKRIKGLVSLIVPLFVSSFAMSDDLAFALEARGYDPKGERTRYRVLKWKKRDTITFIVVAIYMAGFITLLATRFDFMKILFPNVW